MLHVGDFSFFRRGVDNGDNVIFARGSILYSYVPGWRAYSLVRGRSSQADAHLYIRWAKVAARKPNLLFHDAYLLQFATPWNTAFPEEKKKPASDAPISPFFLLFLFAEREETRVCILWPVLHVG